MSDWRPEVGTLVRLQKDHPAHGHEGCVIEHHSVKFLGGKPGMSVEITSGSLTGIRVGVLSPEEFVVVEEAT